MARHNVISTDDWLAVHRHHGDLTQRDVPHPDGGWYRLVCDCGATHLVNRPEDSKPEPLNPEP